LKSEVLDRLVGVIEGVMIVGGGIEGYRRECRQGITIG